MFNTSLYINLRNLENNINFIKSLKSSKNKTVIAVIKSDAYGHGLLPVAETLFNNGINFFGVIGMEEAKSILKNIPDTRLLMLKGVPEDDIAEAAELNLRISVISLDYLKMLLNKAKKFNKPVNIHIKFDSGMNRLGLDDEEINSAIAIIKENKRYLKAEGLFSHFSSAGDDMDYTNFQINNYRKIISLFNNSDIKPLYTHISASSSLLNDKITDDYSNAVRPGISIYGINPNLNSKGYYLAEINPLMALKSRVIQIKKVKKGEFISYNNTYKALSDMNIAIVPAGYDNGIPRLLSNKGRFLINGKFAPITGIVTMNMTIVDITKIEGVKPGTEVIITGKDGPNEITLEEIASIAQTIPYEICLNLGKSNKRIYI
ncbi:MAG: alanine racemase [bacterium]